MNWKKKKDELWSTLDFLRCVNLSLYPEIIKELKNKESKRRCIPWSRLKAMLWTSIILSHLSSASDFREKRNDAVNPQRLMPTVKHGIKKVIEEADIYRGSLGRLITLRDCITVKEYGAILQNEEHPVVQRQFPCGTGMQRNDDATLHTAKWITK